MTKKQLVKYVAEKSGRSEHCVNEVLDSLGKVCCDNIMNEGEIIPLFCSIRLTNAITPSRRAYNMNTDSYYYVPAKRVPKIKTGAAFKRLSIELEDEEE